MRSLREAFGRKGASATEFAIWVPALALLLLGGFDLGNQVQTGMRLEHAVRAGAQLAFAAPSDEGAIRQTVQRAWPALAVADITITCFCAGTAQACAAACTAPQARIITISASRTLSPLLLPGTNRSLGHATVRLG
ncbi:TadE/TadG family type IV pilus assembly protein [Muricoccus aerilatus]|uniref:TadE/TadG family type IV pilus assembly protein n=1 Tax=Muricoccus aerilatus TaxID=452982 RepID=UPI000A058254